MTRAHGLRPGHEYIVQRLTKLHKPTGQVQYGVFEKFASAYIYSKLHKKNHVITS